ncbi:hypothetical protein HaLaN_10770 [Haematococcus lacustris]|uniref:Uncharacterized protein n=1 Tax=Haematococcus lacustris TaxID=44745 RepID=A0A699Z6C4_HAELA|nr:hypothetical protein HaLaN_10770 [Haematococcus lacustris]
MQLHAFKEHINQAKEVVQYFTHMSLPHELLRQQRAALATSYHLAAATAGAGAGTTPVARATRSAVGTATVVGAVPAPKVELQQMSQTRFASLYDMLRSVQNNKQALRSVAWSGALGNDDRSRAITAMLDWHHRTCCEAGGGIASRLCQPGSCALWHDGACLELASAYNQCIFVMPTLGSSLVVGVRQWCGWKAHGG